MKTIADRIFRKYGTASVIGAVVLGLFVWLLGHLAAEYGEPVSILWGLVGYTKKGIAQQSSESGTSLELAADAGHSDEGLQELLLDDFGQHGGFKDAIMSAEKNLYIAGLADIWMKDNYSDDLKTLFDNGVRITSLLYLPEDTTHALFSRYLDYFRFFKPSGNDYINELHRQWKEFDCSVIGKIMGPPMPTEHPDLPEKKFYHIDPVGWVIVVDATHDPPSAKAAYFFPYLSEAEFMKRPGFVARRDNPLNKALVEWVIFAGSSENSSNCYDNHAILQWWRKEIDKLESE